jgi:hypothetical protein
MDSDAAQGARDRERRSQRHTRHHMDTIRRLVDDQRRADPSDPFTAARVFTHLTQGIAELEDYHVDWVAQDHGKAKPANMRRM